MSVGQMLVTESAAEVTKARLTSCLIQTGTNSTSEVLNRDKRKRSQRAELRILLLSEGIRQSINCSMHCNSILQDVSLDLLEVRDDPPVDTQFNPRFHSSLCNKPNRRWTTNSPSRLGKEETVGKPGALSARIQSPKSGRFELPPVQVYLSQRIVSEIRQTSIISYISVKGSVHSLTQLHLNPKYSTFEL